MNRYSSNETLNHEPSLSGFRRKYFQMVRTFRLLIKKEMTELLYKKYQMKTECRLMNKMEMTEFRHKNYQMMRTF